MSSKPATENTPQDLPDLLAKAAEALGGAERLRAVKSLSVSGTFRRSFPDQERSGDYRFFFLSPERFKKIENAGVAKGTEVILTETLNENDAWTGTGVKTNAIQVELDKLGAHAQPSSPYARQQIRANLVRHAFPVLMAAETIVFKQITHTDKPEFDMALRDGFTARVTLDPSTLLPLDMRYLGRPPMIAVNQATVAKGPEAHNTKMVVHFSDYRAVDGIKFPHKITVESDGKLVESFETKSCRINPPEVRASDFER